VVRAAAKEEEEATEVPVEPVVAMVGEVPSA
jgi:hypothetical protein